VVCALLGRGWLSQQVAGIAEAVGCHQADLQAATERLHAELKADIGFKLIHRRRADQLAHETTEFFKHFGWEIVGPSPSYVE